VRWVSLLAFASLDCRAGPVWPGDEIGGVLYSYALGERSARKSERRWVEDVAYPVLAVNLAPVLTGAGG
jgi:hypothetical protein